MNRSNNKRLLGFMLKEFRHILRDRRSLLILFGMPIIQILLFGYAITNEIKDVQIAVLDRAQDSTSRGIISAFQAADIFSIAKRLQHEREIEGIFQEGDVKLALVIPAGLDLAARRGEQPEIQLIADASDPNAANTIVSYAQSILANFTTSSASIKAAGLSAQTRMRFNPELTGVYMFVPGVMAVILMLVSAMMTSISIARERELGTMELLLVSPLNSTQVIVGKVFPYVLLALANGGLILALGMGVFSVPMNGSVLLLAAETLLFVLSALALGILISTITTTQQAALMASLMGLMLPTILLSGFIFPISSLPLPLQGLSAVMPARWYVEVLRAIMLKGVGLAVIWPQTLILGAMTALFMVVSVRRFNMRIA